MSDAPRDPPDPLLELLRARGLRITQPRRAILAILRATAKPLRAVDILERLPASRRDRVTVYRNLEALARAGLLHAVTLEDGRRLYKIGEGDGHNATAHADQVHHHHLVCRICHRVDILEGCPTAPLESAARARGFVAISHVLELFGICPACASMQPNEKAGGT